MDYLHILTDLPLDGVFRITLNRPEKRNAMNNVLRTELFHALEQADQNPEIKLTILRGAGKAFCAGYDLAANLSKDQPYYSAGGDGFWPRHVVDGAMRIWDLAKPVIAQVHGYCLAGGTELATSCDLVYVAEDAQIGYPVVRSMSPPDNQFYPWVVGFRRAMELMLTGDAMSGTEAAATGFANRAFSSDELEQQVLNIAARMSKIPSDIQQFNKRAVHRQMDIMGMRAGIRAGTEMQALAMHSVSTQNHVKKLQQSVTAALTERDQEFGDYRTGEED